MTSTPYDQDNVRKGIFHYVTGRAFVAVASVAVYLLLVRIMSVADYADFATATGMATVLVMLSMCGLDRVVLKYLPEGKLAASPAELGAFVFRMVGARMLAAILFLAAVGLVGTSIVDLLRLPHDIRILGATAAYVLLFAFTDFSAYCLQALMRQDYLRLGVSIAWALRLAFVGVGLYAGGGVSIDAIMLVWTAAEFAAACVMAWPLFAVMRPALGAATGAAAAPTWPAEWVSLRRLAASNFVSSVFGIPWQPYALRTVAAGLLPDLSLAAYGFHQILVERIRGYLPFHFFASLTEPLMSARLTNGEERQRVLDNLAIIVQGSIWLLAPLVTVFSLVGGPAVALLTGGKYAEFSPVLAILIGQLLLGVQVGMLWSFFSVLGESSVIWRAAALPSIITFPLLLICGKTFGIYGMALAAPLNTGVVLAVMIRRLHQRDCTYPLRWPPLLRIMLTALIVPLPAGVLVGLADAGAVSSPALLAALLLGGLGYLGVSWYLWPFTGSQTDTILRLAPGFARFVRKGSRP